MASTRISRPLSDKETEMIFGDTLRSKAAMDSKPTGRGEAAIDLLGDFIFGRKPWSANKAAQDAADVEDIPELEEEIPELIEVPNEETEEEMTTRKKNSTSATDAQRARESLTKVFNGVSYEEGMRKYRNHQANDAAGPELGVNHFFNGVPYTVGKAAHDAYLEKRRFGR